MSYLFSIALAAVIAFSQFAPASAAESSFRRDRVQALTKMNSVKDLVDWLQAYDPKTISTFRGEQTAFLKQHLAITEIKSNSLRIAVGDTPPFEITYDGHAFAIDGRKKFDAHESTDKLYRELQKYFDEKKTAAIFHLIFPSAEAAIPDFRNLRPTAALSAMRELIFGRTENDVTSWAVDDLKPTAQKRSQLYAFKCSGDVLDEAVFMPKKGSPYWGDLTGPLRLKAEKQGSKTLLKIYRCSKPLQEGVSPREDVLDKVCGDLINEVEGRGFTGNVTDPDFGEIKAHVPQFDISHVKSCSTSANRNVECYPAQFKVKNYALTDLISVDTQVGGLAWCCSNETCAQKAAAVAIPPSGGVQMGDAGALHE